MKNMETVFKEFDQIAGSLRLALQMIESVEHPDEVLIVRAEKVRVILASMDVFKKSGTELITQLEALSAELNDAG